MLAITTRSRLFKAKFADMADAWRRKAIRWSDLAHVQFQSLLLDAIGYEFWAYNFVHVLRISLIASIALSGRR